MKLGIEGRTAIVCGASKGLGLGCAAALAAEGVRIILNARDPARLEATAAALRDATGAEVIAVPGDVGTAEGRGGAARRLSRARHPGQQCRRPAARRFSRMGGG